MNKKLVIFLSLLLASALSVGFISSAIGQGETLLLQIPPPPTAKLFLETVEGSAQGRTVGGNNEYLKRVIFYLSTSQTYLNHGSIRALVYNCSGTGQPLTLQDPLATSTTIFAASSLTPLENVSIKIYSEVTFLFDATLNLTTGKSFFICVSTNDTLAANICVGAVAGGLSYATYGGTPPTMWYVLNGFQPVLSVYTTNILGNGGGNGDGFGDFWSWLLDWLRKWWWLLLVAAFIFIYLASRK